MTYESGALCAMAAQVRGHYGKPTTHPRFRQPVPLQQRKPVYTRKKRIFAHRRSSDGIAPRRSSFYQKNSLIFQVKTCESKAENTQNFERRTTYEK